MCVCACGRGDVVVCSVVAAHSATALLGNERRNALPLIDAFARTFHVPYVSVTSSPPNAAAVMATRDAAAEAGDENRAFVLYIQPSYRRAIVDVVRAYHWTRIYYIYTDPEGRISQLKKIIIIAIGIAIIAVGRTRSRIQKCFQRWQRKNRGSTKTLQDRKWHMRDMFLEVVVGLMHC